MKGQGDLSRGGGVSSLIERRQSERARIGLKVHIRAAHPVNHAPVIGPAITHDISLGGIALTTRHTLRAGQVVDVSIPTEGVPGELGLPNELAGRAIVRRIETDTQEAHRVSMAFLPSLANSMELAFLMAYLLGATVEPALAG